MSNLPFITLHPAQIKDIAAATGVPGKLAVQVRASAEHKQLAIDACEAVGIPAVPMTIEELDGICDQKFDKSHPSYIEQRMKFKAQIHAGGLLLELPRINAEAVTRAALCLKKAGIEPPKDRAYSVKEFDALLAGKELSVEHKLEIKAALFAAGLLEGGAVNKPSTQPKALEAAKTIVNTLGLELPSSGKLPVGAVDAAMEKVGWDITRRLNAKIALGTAGVI